MIKLNFQKQILPHLIILILFIAIVFAYFSPVLSNKTIKQEDIIQAAGSAQELKEYERKTGEQALWTNSMFGGMPTYLIHLTYPGEFLKNAIGKVQYFFPHPCGLVLVNLICFYILLLAYGLSPIYAAIGAVAFAFSTFSFVSIDAGHNNKIKALGYAPLILAGVVLVFRKKYLSGFLTTALGVMLNIGSNHYQITYYLILILVIYGVSEFVFAIEEKRSTEFFKGTAILVFAGLLGLATNIASFWCTYEYAKYSNRSKSEISKKVNESVNTKGGLERDYAFNWSYGKFETFSLLIPNINGGASTGSLTDKSEVYSVIKNNYPQVDPNQVIKNLPLYWGDQPSTAGPTYFGAIICFLFILGMLILDNRTRFWILAATILPILLSWGKNFETLNYFLFDYFPGYDKFRSVSMTLIIAQICVTITALLALHKILESSFDKKMQKRFFISVASTAGLCLLFILFAGSGSYASPYDQQVFGDATQLIDALREDRQNLLRSDAVRSCFLIIVSAALIYAALKNKMSKQMSLIVIGLFVLGDFWLVNKRYLNNEDFERRAVEASFEPTPADEAILKDQSLNYRVLNLNNPFNEAKTSYYHKSIGGYHAAKMKRYADVIENVLDKELNVVVDNLKKGSLDFSKMSTLNMLNAKYFKFSDEATGVIGNKFALGNAWFVQNIRKVNNADEEILALKDFNPQNTAVVDVTKFKVSDNLISVPASASIKLVEYLPGVLKYESNSTADAFAIFSEIFYPEGWIATVDGKEVEILRANYILRALPLASGKHVIKFKFEPKSFALGNKIAFASSSILIIIFLGGIIMSLKNKL